MQFRADKSTPVVRLAMKMVSPRSDSCPYLLLNYSFTPSGGQNGFSAAILDSFEYSTLFDLLDAMYVCIFTSRYFADIF